MNYIAWNYNTLINVHLIREIKTLIFFCPRETLVSRPAETPPTSQHSMISRGLRGLSGGFRGLSRGLRRGLSGF